MPFTEIIPFTELCTTLWVVHKQVICAIVHPKENYMVMVNINLIIKLLFGWCLFGAHHSIIVGK